MAGRPRESGSADRSRGLPQAGGPRSAARAPLVDAEDRFVAAWGQMGSTWGVSRTMAEAHALLFITGRPLCTDEVMERLEISRGNASMSLRALLDWGIVTRVHKRGDRKEYFEAEQDPWTWFHACIRERRRREVVPVVDAMHEITDHAKLSADAADAAGSPEAGDLHDAFERIARFAKFMDEFQDLIDAFLAVGAGPLGKALRTVAKFVPKAR